MKYQVSSGSINETVEADSADEAARLAGPSCRLGRFLSVTPEGQGEDGSLWYSSIQICKKAGVWGPDRGLYLSEIPKSNDDIPTGQVLVHNRVRPAERSGERGFRWWMQQPNERTVVCDCGWAPEIMKHYRIAAT